MAAQQHEEELIGDEDEDFEDEYEDEHEDSIGEIEIGEHAEAQRDPGNVSASESLKSLKICIHFGLSLAVHIDKIGHSIENHTVAQ